MTFLPLTLNEIHKTHPIFNYFIKPQTKISLSIKFSTPSRTPFLLVLTIPNTSSIFFKQKSMATETFVGLEWPVTWQAIKVTIQRWMQYWQSGRWKTRCKWRVRSDSEVHRGALEVEDRMRLWWVLLSRGNIRLGGRL